MRIRPNTLRINVGRLMSDTGVQMEEWQEEPKNQRHASAPGAELAAQREALGMTVDQIADQLKLAPRQVIAIEKGDYDSLPNMAVTRGFIRAYAKAVRLDPAPLVAMIQVEGAVGHATATVRPTRVTASFSESRFPTLTERQGKPFGLIIGGIAVVVLLAAAGAWKAGLISPATFGARGTQPAATDTNAGATATAPLTTQPQTVQPAAPAAEQAPLQSPNVPLISVPPQPGSSNAPVTMPGAGVNPAPAPSAAPAGAAPAPTGTQPGAAPAAQPATPGVKPAAVPPAATPAGVKPAAVQPAAPAAIAPAAAAAAPTAHEGGGKLVLNVVEDSWIEIRRPGANSLIARLVKAGNTESFDVRAKDLVIVGKPTGVQASLAGSPLELPQAANGSIARVNIK
jgi:cytoskeleton protein RodZ